MKNTTKDVYVLTRIYNSYSKNSKFKERFAAAAESVSKNAKTYRQGKVVWMLYDDSPEDERYQKHEEELLAICSSKGFSKEKGNLFPVRSKQPGNSSYAAFCIRNEFLKITEGKNGTVAVCLDQDDTLTPDAINHIVGSMPENGVVLTPFTIIDDGGKDITGDGGKIQRELTKAISKNRIDNQNVPNTEDSIIVRFWKLIRFCINKIVPFIGSSNDNNLNDIFYASSIGWTKSYSREALELYQNALKGFLMNERGGIYDYYRAHPAYEDFVDFVVLLLKDVTISATEHVTHLYYKHSEAITTNPDINSFKLHRTANLLALIDLCYLEAENLRSDFKQLLLRFVTIKIVDVERILADYRADYLKGYDRYYAFAEDTHECYFLRKLYRLSQGDNRGKKQDKELFEAAAPIRTNQTKANFDDLFSCDNINKIKAYHADLKTGNSRLVLQKAYEEENQYRPKKKDNKEEEVKNKAKKRESQKEEDICKKYDDKLTPNQLRCRYMWGVLIIWIAIIIGFATWAFFNGGFSDSDSYGPPILALMAAVLTFFLSELSKTYVLAKEEASKKKLYFSEFEDLKRHLEANLKVMIEIRKQMDAGKVPASVHFNNLSWPQSSCLFSDDISGILDKKKVDDFARLKVNLRNIQNSSRWLSNFMREPHSSDEICKAIDWEIARHIGYLMNIHYMQNNGFSFASQGQLDFYIREQHMREYLSGLFMSYHGEDDKNTRMQMVEKYLEQYYEDRRECRNVLLFPK